MFWGAATATIEEDFKSKMQEIKETDEEAYAFLMEKEPATWCKAFFQTHTKCASFENGISESFNGKIVSARGKPLITMLEDIRVYIMQRMWHMSEKAAACDDLLTPSIRKHMEQLKHDMRKWQVVPSTYQVVEVRKRNEAYGVNLIARTCDCRLWELSGIPCVHAVAGYLHFKLNPDDGVSSWYTQAKWFDSYQFSIKPVYGSKIWRSTTNTPPLPPIVKKMPGRPRKLRIPHPSEQDDEHHVSRFGRVMTCQNCWRKGHNKASCTNPKTYKPRNTDPPRPPKCVKRKSGITINDDCKSQKEVGETSKRGGGNASRGRGLQVEVEGL